ncbi:MAG: PhaM family polyhydroxyalkanoate granule multifunctional regulatory protein [Janthinobacterium lividum]
MNQSSMPNLAGADAMGETLEFIRNLWGGGMKIPGMTMPTLSIEEIDKQIADLKAVESWLTLNMNMLRGTIQALEVQSGTLSALKSMSDSMTAMVKPAVPEAGTPAPNFDFSAFMATPPAAQETAGSAAQVNTSPVPQPEVENAGGKLAPETPQSDAAALPAVPFADPAAWWNLLQNQFKQAVDTAMAPGLGKSAADAGQAGATRPAGAKARSTARTAGTAAMKGPLAKPRASAKASVKTPAKPKAKATARRSQAGS